MAVRQKPVNLDEYDEVANQGRFLLNNFVYEQMRIDHIQNAPDLAQLQGPGVPRGLPLEVAREIGRAVKFVGEAIQNDLQFKELMSRVPPEAQEQTLLNVAGSIFEDGKFNWGRVVALFYFAYKVCVKAVNSIELMRNVINIIVQFMRGHVVQWIVEHGGWTAILDYMSNSRRQIGYFVIGGLVVCAGAFLYHKYLS